MERPADAVSTVIPTYNRAAMAARAVASALAQARPGDEVIVVDDGSTDGTEDRLREFSGRIVYKKVANGRVGRARNIGMDLASRPLLCFLDSDDEWLPGKQELQRRLLVARPEVVLCYGDMRGVYPDGSVRARLSRRYEGGEAADGFLGPKVPFSSIAELPAGASDFAVRIGDLYPEQLERERVQIGTMMARRETLVRGGVRFPEHLRFTEDAEFVARAARLGPAAFMDVEVELFHEHGEARMTDLDALVIAAERLGMLERVWGSDAAFRAAHDARYRRAVCAIRLLRTRILLSEGRRAEARAELALMDRPPLSYRALCRAPAPLLVLAARVKALLR